MVRRRSATSSGLVVELLVTSRNRSPRRRASARKPAAPAIGSRPVYTTPSRSISTPFRDDQSMVTLKGYGCVPPLPLGEGWGEGAVRARAVPLISHPHPRCARFYPLPEGEAKCRH